jgi:3-hydroxyisobutyrate dehydrogenase-like beta-hydroxyacid dehydrogenase
MPDRVLAGGERIGFIGLGHMGLPMCANLLRAGADLTVFNRTPGRAAPLVAQGARQAASAAALAASCDVVLTCLATVDATEAVVLGPDGVLEGARPGTIVVDHGTIGPGTAARLAAAAGERGVGFLDAPVSGGPEGAAAATLTIMAGGPEAHFARVEPVLRAYGRLVVRVGPVGAGSRLKLINQLLTLVHGAVAAEALALARRAGLDVPAAGEVLRQSFGQSRMLERALPRIRDGQYDAGAALRLYRKDLGLVLETGQEAGAALPLAKAALAVLDEALAAGLADHDIAALYLLYGRER